MDTESWRYMPCFVGAYIGYFFPKGNASHKTKGWTVGISGAVATLFPLPYNYLSGQPPTEGNVEYISFVCLCLFLTLHFAIGFFFTNFGKVMMKPPAQTQSHE
jgi:hypothetical protein